MAYNLDEKHIMLTEQKLNVVFPKSYRKAIMANNGGLVISPLGEEEGVWFLYPFFDDTDKKRLKKTSIDIVRENQTAWNQYGLPQNLYAIGHSDDEYLVFKKTENNLLEDAVYKYHHSYNLELLADDFSMLTHES